MFRELGIWVLGLGFRFSFLVLGIRVLGLGFRFSSSGLCFSV